MRAVGSKLVLFTVIFGFLLSFASAQSDVFIGEAGLETDLNDAEWQSVSLGAEYGEVPLVFATTQTTNGGQDPSGANIKNVSKSGFETQHCEYEGSDGCDGHAEEDNAWFTVDPSVIESIDGMDSGTVETIDGSGGYRINFSDSIENTPYLFTNIQTEKGDEESLNTQARDVTSDNATVEFCEQEGNDGCDSNHESERVAWLAVDPGIIERQPGFDFGNFTKGDSNWQGVSFSQDFSEKPMVIADVQTENGNQEALYPEVNSVGTDGASIRFCESEGYDDCDTHDTEEIAWMAIAPGNVSINATGRSLCDERGPRNECISNTVHEIDSEFYNISSVFQTRRSSVFSALTERATIKVENSSEISGFWNGSFNITSQETTIKPGAEFKPRNGRIIIG